MEWDLKLMMMMRPRRVDFSAGRERPERPSIGDVIAAVQKAAVRAGGGRWPGGGATPGAAAVCGWARIAT